MENPLIQNKYSFYDNDNLEIFKNQFQMFTVSFIRLTFPYEVYESESPLVLLPIQ